MRSVAFLLFGAWSAANYGQAATVDFPDNSCDQWKTQIEEEMQFTVEMASTTAGDLQKGGYYDIFFAEILRLDPEFAQNTEESFTRISDMATGTSSGYKFKVTCDDTTNFCAKKKFIAHMNDKKTTMNLCKIFFNDPNIKGTQDRQGECSTMDIRAAQRTRSAILIHELTHTKYAMLDGDPAHDYAYGFNGNYQLAQGTFDRSCAPYKDSKKILCPVNGVEGLCPAAFSGGNADTYSFVASGVYFSTKCNAQIPLPPLPNPLGSSILPSPTPTPSLTLEPPLSSLITPISSVAFSAIESIAATPSDTNPTPIPAKYRRDVREIVEARAECPIYDDYIQWDEEVADIEGYVHFGDSYGAGMGTGTTTGDGCRVGQNNFGDLLYRWLDDDSIPFEKKVCSGDTTKGLNRQIDEWSDPGKATVGTVSIGGNDVGFSDLVWYCVITPNTARLGSTNRANCVEAENKARDMMKDEGENGIKAKLKAAYKKILDKSARDDFHLYVTSYVGFFNHDTTDCDKSTFHYWWAAYNPPSDWPTNRIVYLTTDLRHEINDLVTNLNNVISAAVSDVNKERGGEQVHFVDVNPRFNVHRWCEQGDWHEPAPQVESTWFFLSGWPDVSIEGANADTAAVESAEIASLISAGSIPVPDSNCRASLDSDADPYLRAMCNVAEAVAEDPEGPEAKYLADANADIQSGNVTSQHIGWFTPTRQIKTFHPRSPGMVAYRDAVIDSMQGVGQL
ncbi:SGNH hydrolase [Lojkania enalia]|uniref:SGNH hydrolase n=1 Tax=Lojkania enalia TaxID=147567 RepID=A0A9P4KG68_9PLEO|nr:SGNH hydrolase [Didymosphaeria enalia]